MWVQLNIGVSKIKERVKQGLSTSIRARRLGGCHAGHMTSPRNTVKTRDWEPAFSKDYLKRLLHKINGNLHKFRLLGLFNKFLFCDRFEPRSHFKSSLSLIVRVNVALNGTVVVDSEWRFDNLCGSYLQSQSESYHVSWWYYTLVIDLIGQLRRDVIGRLSVKPWCYWLWRLVISDWCVSIRLLSQLNSRLLLVKLSVLQSLSRS